MDQETYAVMTGQKSYHQFNENEVFQENFQINKKAEIQHELVVPLALLAT